MGLTFHICVVVIGVALILVSARIVIASSLGLARKFGFSETFIGMSVLSIGTSLPETLTHIAASLRILRDPGLMDQMSALAIGGNIGSDIFQQNFLMGIVALICAVKVSRNNLRRNVGGLVVASVALFAFSIGGAISRFEGSLLAGGYVLYIYAIARHGKESEDEGGAESVVPQKGLGRLAAESVTGFIIMAIAADRVLNSSLVIVERTFLSYSFFGVLVLGIATALPELSTALMSALGKRPSMSASILIGSNITNPAFSLGLGAAISGYTVPGVVVWYDMPVKIITAGLIYFLLRKHSTMRKRHALVLIASYFGYVLIRQAYFPADY